jgi:hypothetical protein
MLGLGATLLLVAALQGVITKDRPSRISLRAEELGEKKQIGDV